MCSCKRSLKNIPVMSLCRSCCRSQILHGRNEHVERHGFLKVESHSLCLGAVILVSMRISCEAVATEYSAIDCQGAVVRPRNMYFYWFGSAMSSILRPGRSPYENNKASRRRDTKRETDRVDKWFGVWLGDRLKTFPHYSASEQLKTTVRAWSLAKSIYHAGTFVSVWMKNV